jgi:hypothetical protein
LGFGLVGLVGALIGFDLGSGCFDSLVGGLIGLIGFDLVELPI